MAIHWQVKFKSLRSAELYTVNIYDDNYSGIPIQLTGAARPFETQEDDSDDWFQTVRTQSGYLRIIDTGEDGSGNSFNWRNFIPTNDIDRPVTLTNSNGDVVWCGFMQAQNFGSAMYDMPQEREFPLQCPLTVASRADISVAITELHNFAYLLLQAIDYIPYVCRPNMFYFQGLDTTVFLQKKIDWQNFVQEDDEGISGKYDLLTCISEMCKFCGWTVRVHRDALYFVCPDETDSNLVEIDYSDLQNIAYESSFWVQNAPYTPVTFGSDIFASTSNADFQLRGPNTAKITANSNQADQSVISTFPDSVIQEMEDGSTYQEQYGNNLRAFFSDDITSIGTPFLTGSCAASTESFNIMEIVEGSGFTPTPENSQKFNTIRIRQTYNGNVLVSLETVFEHTFYSGGGGAFISGGVAITGDVYRQGVRYQYADEVTGAGKSHIYFRVGIGSSRSSALWLGGSSPSSSPVAFGVAVGGSNREGFLWASHTNDTDLRGRLFIDILGSDDMQHESSTGYIDRFELVNLNVTFTRGNELKKKASRKYVAHNDTMVKEEFSDDTIFSTDNMMTFGYGLLLNPDGTMFKGIDYGNGVLTPPEQHLADRIANYWSTSKRKMSVELRADKNMQTGTYTTESIVDLSPGMKATLDNTYVYPFSISHDWRDDIVKAVFLEI